MIRRRPAYPGVLLGVAAVTIMSILHPRQGLPPRMTEELSPAGQAYVRFNTPDAEDVRIEVVWPSDHGMRPGANQDVPTVGSRLILSGGAKGYTPGEAKEVFSDLAAEASIWNRQMETGVSLKVPRRNLAAAITLANLHLRSPAMSENWFRRERAYLAQSNREEHALPDRLLRDALRCVYFGDGPLRRMLTGETPESVMSMTRDDVAGWQRATFTSHPKTVIIAGGVDVAEAGAAIDALLAGLPDIRRPSADANVRTDFRPRRILLHMPSAKTTHLLISGVLPPISAGLAREDDLILEALAGPGSVMYETARSNLHATYSFDWETELVGESARYFRLEGEIETDEVARVEAELRRAYASFRETAEPMDIDVLLSRTAAALREARDDPTRAAGELLYDMETRQGSAALEDPDKALASITSDSVLKRLHRSFPQASELTVMVASWNAKALPGACVITAPQQAASCK